MVIPQLHQNKSWQIWDLTHRSSVIEIKSGSDLYVDQDTTVADYVQVKGCQVNASLDEEAVPFLSVPRTEYGADSIKFTSATCLVSGSNGSKGYTTSDNGLQHSFLF